MSRRACYIESLGEISNQYGGIILDLFGTIHDGIKVFPGVIDRLQTLGRNGVRVCLLSNSPRRRVAVGQRLAEMGIGPELYRGLETSGELTFEALSGKGGSSFGERYVHIGPEELAELLDGSGQTRVEAISDADFLVCTGLKGTTEQVAATLSKARKKDLIMVCANPDRQVMIGAMPVKCAGAIAERYEELKGTVEYFGKPYPAAYERALTILDLPPNQILAIGDAVETDIAGAHRAGIDAALVLTGIHRSKLTDTRTGRLNPRNFELLSLDPDPAVSFVLPAFG